MSGRNGGARLPLGRAPLAQLPLISWLSVGASLLLHALPLAFPPSVLVQSALPLRTPDAQLEVLHEISAPGAAVHAAAPALAAPEPPARAVPAASAVVAREPAAPIARRREAVPRAMVSPPPSPAPEPVAPEPAIAEPERAEPPVEQGPPAESASAATMAEALAVATIPAPGPVVAGNASMASGAPGAAARGGAGSIPGSTGPDVATLRAQYLHRLRERVLARREYPRLARRAGLEGTVCLRISLDATGGLAQLRATCVAPEPLLEAALRAVRDAAPFGPLPGGLGKELIIDLPVVFQLDAG